ncbi:tripartite motif-containing protein 66 isoform X2 [Syngnathoides biaculeatus]|uniref:tripartite motif-containing protein 66 isoform X2 n=1 Tax=Syngnathoides biaculeatus TaxID=300417 RepID=UPI002ADD630F|nr:tripartite motif-containing protein 66 isoform X2 [Syngnathoides biaculeatus]
MEKSCSDCSETTLAQSLCTLCNKRLCYQCTDMHQHQRAAAPTQYADLHEPLQRGAGSLPATGPGTGSYPCPPLLVCHSHRQQPLELLCESCDLLCCSSCHLSSHKTHRVLQIGKALEDQRWLFESLTVQVEEKRSAVESNAKQIEDRVHGVKIAHRKAENQIKMAKMIMINELNKRANLLIEQLEKISEDFQQRLEDQLQGAIETCAQLDQVQKFIHWATTHHCRGPVLFSRGMISLQIQQLLDSSLQSESWSPVKIKFNWDASYWTKQMSSLGQLTVEGGNCPFPQGLACASVLRPQPISCLALPPVCHRGRESACGYQMCCGPRLCCLHGLPSQSDLDKSQLGAPLYNSTYVPPGPGSRLPSQQLLRCWDPSDSSTLQTSSQCPSPSSHIPIAGPIHINCNRGPPSQPQSAVSESQSLPESHLLHHHHQRGSLPVGNSQQSADQHRSRQSWEKSPGGATLQEVLDETVAEQDCAADDSRGEPFGAEAGRGQTAVGEHEEPQPETSQQRFQVSPTAEPRKERQRTGPAPTLRAQSNGRRSASPEVPATAGNCGADLQQCRLNASSTCDSAKRRPQSIPVERAAPPASSYSERPAGSTHGRDVGTAKTPTGKYAGADPRQRRASDGVLCIVKETSADIILTRSRRSPLLSYKTEPDPSYLNDEIRLAAKEKHRVSANAHNGDSESESGRARVPVVCLERLKVLISRLPSHGRRQSDPLPASTAERDRTSQQQQQQEPWQDLTHNVVSGASENKKSHSVTPSRCTGKHQWLTVDSEWDTCPRASFPKASKLPPDDSQDSNSPLDFDSDSDPKSVPEEAAVSQDDQRLDSDTSPEFSSEAELEGLYKENEVLQSCNRNGSTGDSDQSLERDPESASGAGSEDGQGLEVDVDSGAAETESDTQPELDSIFQAETDSDQVSDQKLGSQGSAESEVDVESELETTDDPQPLRSDLEEEDPFGPGQRPLLIANPGPPRRAEAEEDDAQVESEDFCGVCLIGGDLLCCDGCPKVYHLSCHIPPLLSFPSGDWLCSLCRDVAQPEVEYDCENRRTSGEHVSVHGLSACDQRKCERLTLLILNNILSAPFHEPVSPLARHYYQIIKRPIDLSVIRARLNKRSTQHYNSPDQFVADVDLMFHNCAKFNYPDSEVAQAGRSLRAFFASKLEEVFPGRVFPVTEADSDSDEYDEAFRANEGGFPWPERREQCHRKRKRRQSLKSRRHHM